MRNSYRLEYSWGIMKHLWIHQNAADILLPTFGTTKVNVQLSPPLCHSVGGGGNRQYPANKSLVESLDVNLL